MFFHGDLFRSPNKFPVSIRRRHYNFYNQSHRMDRIMVYQLHDSRPELDRVVDSRVER